MATNKMKAKAAEYGEMVTAAAARKWMKAAAAEAPQGWKKQVGLSANRLESVLEKGGPFSGKSHGNMLATGDAIRVAMMVPLPEGLEMDRKPVVNRFRYEADRKAGSEACLGMAWYAPGDEIVACVAYGHRSYVRAAEMGSVSRHCPLCHANVRPFFAAGRKAACDVH